MMFNTVKKRAGTSNGESGQKPIDEPFKILIAADCHLGYGERMVDDKRRSDSFDTFEEILQLASQEKVDFVLLGGDLFHDCNPSQTIVLKCINLLNKYCLGTNDIKFEFLTEPSEVLSIPSSFVNYEDENINIALPVFAIHENHDNPNFDYTSTLDLLVALGLVNCFGKLSDPTELTVTPMIFKKGSTYLAIYGISYNGEQQLSRLLSQERVKFLRPKDIENCFNILVIHHNRAQHTKSDYIADNKLPSFFDLILWGHEPECRLTPEEIQVDDTHYHVTQPGSSVATSQCEGEAKPKHVGILTVPGRNRPFHMKEIKLQTVRPFVFDDLSLAELIRDKYCVPTADGIFEYVDGYIDTVMLQRANELRTGHPKQPKEPLLRLRLMYSDDSQKFDCTKIIRKYGESVANPKDIIVFCKEKTLKNRVDVDDYDDHVQALADCFRHNEDQDYLFTVQHAVEKYFQNTEEKLTVLSLPGVNEAFKRCVEDNDDNAFLNYFDHQIKKTTEYFIGRKIELTKEAYDKGLHDFQKAKAAKTANDVAEVKRVLQSTQPRQRDPDSDNDGVTILPPTRRRGRGSRGGRVATQPQKPTGRGRAAKKALDVTTSSVTATLGVSTPRSSHATSTPKASTPDVIIARGGQCPKATSPPSNTTKNPFKQRSLRNYTTASSTTNTTKNHVPATQSKTQSSQYFMDDDFSD